MALHSVILFIMHSTGSDCALRETGAIERYVCDGGEKDRVGGEVAQQLDAEWSFNATTF